MSGKKGIIPGKTRNEGLNMDQSPRNLTLPHYDLYERHSKLLPTHMFAMTYKCVLRQGLSKSVRDLIGSVNREDFDQPFAYVLPKMMITYVNMFRGWT